MPNVPTQQNIEDFSPYTLLRNFSKNRVLPCVFAAVIVHVAVIGGLSYEFIYTTWVDPSANAPKTTGAEGADKPAADESATDPSATEPADGAAGEDDSSESTAARRNGSDDDVKRSDDERLDAPVVRDITDKANPDEIPDKPDDFGISIDDTNP